MAFNAFVVDSSALIAFVRREKEAERIEVAFAKSDAVFISAASRLETMMVLSRLSEGFSEEEMSRIESKLNITVVPFTMDHSRVAYLAFEQYGKGMHKAALNFGDCLTYATAKVAGLPLLFVGGDFSLTDIRSVE